MARSCTRHCWSGGPRWPARADQIGPPLSWWAYLFRADSAHPASAAVLGVREGRFRVKHAKFAAWSAV
ncbi:hypothetical protein M201_gp27 [Haloarcula californiae tailed virus 2]|uniref:Uncharacterized protein n=1 Tax=Haloarcula californiae tailed virus 2 TaxID=1273747 RepID=R4THR7_9CAUD|nr:hypothetical protein M201_gp27 [Haloarcula californiae tailed virus 2]AGM11856.1 hypothetical protein HCTV2_28 [Haloarcula californiae tailed virus 2]